MEVISMDLGDFIPENYEFSLKLDGHPYRFAWGEAQVDEVLMMILNPKDEDSIKNQRITVINFLQAHLVEGDKDQLATDLALIPHQTKRGSLSIMELMDVINGRIKKNETGDSPKKTTGRSGSPATSPS